MKHKDTKAQRHKECFLDKSVLFACGFAALCHFVAIPLHAEVLDRIVAVVEGHIITLSDLRQEREIRAQFAEKAIHEDAQQARELVDTYLIEKQIADYPNIDVTSGEVDADLQRLGLYTVTAPEGSRDPARRAIADAQGRLLEISVTNIRNAISRRIRMQKFFDIKFRQLIRPADEEIRKYYEEVFVPAARARGLQSIPPLTDPEMTRAIRENIIQERLNHEVEVWLEAVRRRSNVEVFE
jgi:hypothetical protein